MKKNILVLIFFSFLIAISCTSTSNINTTLYKLEQGKLYTLKVSDKGINLKAKIKLNSFNLKQYKARKSLKDIKSIKVELVTSKLVFLHLRLEVVLINTLNFDVDNYSR
ncbi:MAG: hypothetical protein KatS3mg068_1247 [Candidatus Sericytochromatia bacterium]|nr:MAG: hypothetical protein KatS3mg068_1247 [Candidatus Sericytochromatia bacterium]